MVLRDVSKVRTLGAVLVLGASMPSMSMAQSDCPTPGASASARGPELAYLIGPGDVLDVFVWKEPELTANVTVRFDGRITVPLLGDVVAAGREPQVLANEVAERLRSFVDAPHVTIGVAETTSARIYVVGRVAAPGTFPFTGPISVLQALALAGGLQEFANSDSIVVVREGEGVSVPIPVDYERLKNGKNLEQNCALLPGDTIVVP